MSAAPVSPIPPAPGLVYPRPRTNPARTVLTAVGWASVVLVPAAGLWAMVADQKAGWVAFIFIIALGPCQAVVHLIIAVMLQVARSKAPDRRVRPWIPLAYVVYVVGFLAASFLVLDAGDTPEYYAPWRESAAVAVEPLMGVSFLAFLALFVLTIIDLVGANMAQAAAHNPYLVAPPRS